MTLGQETQFTHKQRLMDLFQFDENDLQLNQSGTVSEKQKQRLNKKRNHLKETLVFAKTYSFGVAKNHPQRIEEWSVKRTEGWVRFIKVITKKYFLIPAFYIFSETYELQVGRRVFEVEWRLLDLIKPDGYYIVYFINLQGNTSKNEILSIEWAASRSTAAKIRSLSFENMELIDAIKKGDLLRAIHLHRKLYDSNYETAKHAVENIQKQIKR